MHLTMSIAHPYRSVPDGSDKHNAQPGHSNKPNHLGSRQFDQFANKIEIAKRLLRMKVFWNDKLQKGKEWSTKTIQFANKLPQTPIGKKLVFDDILSDLCVYFVSFLSDSCQTARSRRGKTTVDLTLCAHAAILTVGIKLKILIYCLTVIFLFMIVWSNCFKDTGCKYSYSFI